MIRSQSLHLYQRPPRALVRQSESFANVLWTDIVASTITVLGDIPLGATPDELMNG